MIRILSAVVTFIACTLICGWINHVVWTFAQKDLAGLIIGLIGVFAAPFGALHGLWLFFV